MELTAFPGWRRRSVFFGLNAALFSLCYAVANLAAQADGVQDSLALWLDRQLPFVAWMIVPYLSSGVLFAASFYVVRTVDDLRVLSARLLLATAVASLIFALFPYQFSIARPPVSAPLFHAMFDYLAWVDRPYNQMPSLHVAYCVILWSALREVPRHAINRAALAIWLALVAASTVFTWQHHLLDVAGGLALGAACVAQIRPDAHSARIGLHYVVAAIVAIFGAVIGKWPILFYIAASFLLVALAYARNDRHFLRKRGGTFPWSTWLLYGPYLLLYRITWLCVRMRERGQAPIRQLNQQLWVGRRLTAREASLLPRDCSVIDLANELSETSCLRSRAYRHVPLLDLRAPDAAVVAAIVDVIKADIARGQIVYLHCAMGYSRCIFIAKYYTDGVGHDVFDLPVEAPLPATAAPPA
jgi:membrane-associated phospholipid phosphatase